MIGGIIVIKAPVSITGQFVPYGPEKPASTVIIGATLGDLDKTSPKM